MNWKFISTILLTLPLGCMESSGNSSPVVQTEPIEQPASPLPPKPPEEESEPTPVEVTYQVVDKAGYDKAIASHKGKIVVVDLWGTWCGSCMENFPHTVAMVGKYRKQPVQIMSLAIDAPGFDETTDEGICGRIHEFLKQQKAAMVNLVSQEALTEGLAASGEVYNFSSLPVFKIYDQSGKLVDSFPRPGQDSFTHKDVETAVDALLKKSSGKE